jgi:hypothetical protein
MTENETPDSQSEVPSWFMDEGIPGGGPRPQWLSEKFKSVADLARSYHELEKKFGNTPDEYDFSKSKYLDPDYGPFLDLKSHLKEKRVSQEVVDKFIESVDKYMDEFNVDYKEEIRKLGDNAQDRIATLNNWAKANLSKQSFEALTSNLKSADAIKALEELRGKMMSNVPQVPNGNDNSSHNVQSLADIQSELNANLDKYKKDENYRKDITRRLEVAAKNAPGFVDKMGA